MKTLSLCAVVGLLWLNSVGRAEDFSQWRGPNRDGVLPATVLPKSLPKELNKRWTVEVGVGHSSPVVADGKVYVFARQKDAEVLRCLDLKTGKELWAKSYEAPYQMAGAARAFGKGPRSTPVVAKGRVFTLGVSGILTAHDAESGKVLWQHTFAKEYPLTSAEYGTSMSPIVYGDTVIAHVGGPKGGALTAFNVADGKTVWSWKEEGPGYASPVLTTQNGKEQLVTLTQTHALAVDPKTGKELWKMAFETDYEQNIVTPVVYKDTVILSGTGRNTEGYALKDGAPSKTWDNPMSQYMSSPVLTGDLLFGFSEKGSGTLFCADAGTGKVLWKGEGRAGENAALLVAGEKLLVLTNTSDLLVLAVDKTGPKVLGQYKVAETPTWATPAIADGALLIKDAERLICYDLSAGS